jgi:hypothetical protein
MSNPQVQGDTEVATDVEQAVPPSVMSRAGVSFL